MKMKKIMRIVLIVFVLLAMILPAFLANIVYASAPLDFSDMDGMRWNRYGQSAFGTSQAYSVMFDGEGDAAVLAVLDFYNPTSADIEQIRIQIPGARTRVITAIEESYMIYNESSCAERNAAGCIRYEQLARPRYGFSQASMANPQLTWDSVQFDIKLKQRLKPMGRTSIILYYKTPDYVKKELALFGNDFSYNFQTIRTEFDVEDIRTGISVNSGLYLDDGQSDVNYLPNFGEAAGVFQKASLSEADFSAVSSWMYRIGDGQSERGAWNLDPWENFSVKGKYSDSWLDVHLISFVLVTFGILVLIFILALVFFKAYTAVKTENISWRAAAAGFLYAFILVAIWALFIVLIDVSNFLRQNELLALLIGIVLGIASLIIIIVPPIYFAVKYSAMHMIWYIIAFFISLIAVSGIAFLAFWILVIGGLRTSVYF